MDSIRHIALGCCVISTVAGMIRVFWPENGFSPVINAILALYIVTAGLQMLQVADWQEVTAHLYQLATTSAPAADYTDYGRELSNKASADAVQEVLRQAGIDAVVTIQEDLCKVELVRDSDRDRAQALLAANCGSLAWEIAAGGDIP